MKTCTPLRKGDCVGLVAPSGFVRHGAVGASVQALVELGLRAAVGQSCFCKDGYLAGADEVRARDINAMIADRNIAGIMAIRGGYGAQRILTLIDWGLFAASRKPFFGYSDATAIHTAIQNRCGLMSYHTPMLATELRHGLDSFSLDAYKACLFGGLKCLCNPSDKPLETLAGGVSEGVLTGGNLAILASSMGTPYALDARGKVLFIEDINEEPYRIDRMLTQLALGGVFADCAGVLLGSFTNCEAHIPSDSLTLRRVLSDHLKGLGKPIIVGLACGHGTPTLSLPLGAAVRLDAEKKEVSFV